MALGMRKGMCLLLCMGALALALAGCAAGSASPGGNVGPAQTLEPNDPVLSVSPTRPKPSPTTTPAASRLATKSPTVLPQPGRTAVSTLGPLPSPTSANNGGFVIGGINLADPTAPITISYPKTFDGEEQVVISDVSLLVSDEGGRSLAVFQDIGSWLGTHKVFVYPDTAAGVPVVSVHNGAYAGVPLEAEPLRSLIEGPLFSPFPLDKVEENLAKLVGATFVLEQGGISRRFEVVQAIRMDAVTTDEFLYRPGEISSLLEPVVEPGETFLWLMCSARQPGEPGDVFAGRFLLALQALP